MEKWKDMQQLLEERRQKLVSRLHKLDIHLRQKEAPLSADWSEQAIELENEEVLQALDQNSRQELEQIKQALLRIKNKTYGICVECEEEISKPRLNALPFTSLCIRCANAVEQRS